MQVEPGPYDFRHVPGASRRRRGRVVSPSWILLAGLLPAIVHAAGPLRVQPLNPRYLTDGESPVTFLTGWYTMANLQDSVNSPVVDFAACLDSLESFGHNFIRLNVWEDAQFAPTIYERTGPGTALDGLPKFDVTRFNTNFFARLRSRVEDAADRGVYVALCLFQGWSIGTLGHNITNPYPFHPFHPDNNINGIDGTDSRAFATPEGYPIHTVPGTGHPVHPPSVTAINNLQKAYIREVVDTLNDLDNVMYEISNESPYDSWPWQYEMINYIRSYQATKPKRHLVGMSAPGGPYSQTGQPWLEAARIFGSPADWVAPPHGSNNGDYYEYVRERPSPWTWPPTPIAVGDKVILLDSDHVKPFDGSLFEGSIDWVWKSFTRGISPFSLDIFYDLEDPDLWPVFHALGAIRALAGEVGFVSLAPSKTIASSKFCLFRPGSVDAEYIAFLPAGGTVTVDLAGTTGPMTVEWIHPETGARIPDNPITADGGSQVFTSLVAGASALHLASAPSPPVAVTPQIVPDGGRFSGSVFVTLDCATEGAAIRYTTDGAEPTESSPAYTAPLILTSRSTVKAKAFAPGYAGSAVAAATFYAWDEPVAADLDGIRRFIDVPTLTNITATSGFSVEFWTFPRSRADGSHVIGATGGWGQFRMNATATGAMVAGTTEGSRFSTSDLGPNTLQTDVWQHFAFTFDGATREAKFYKNGANLRTKTMTAPARWTGFRVGVPSASTVDGLIDELRIYDRALTPQEVADRYASGQGSYGGPESGLVGGWHFDEGTGHVGEDFSGNGHHALLMFGGVWADGKVVPATDEPAAADPPDIAPPGGAYAPSVEVTLSAGDDEAIVYTTDGAEPETTSSRYEGPFALTESATVRARVYRDGHAPSDIAEEVYEISPGAGFFDGLTLE